MALETPNAIVAAGIAYFDAAQPAGQQVTMRSSVGVADKQSEAQQNPSALLATYALENPLTNDEAVVSSAAVGLSNGIQQFCAFGVSPIANASGMTDFDAMPPNLLYVFITTLGGPLAGRARFPFSIMRLITTVEPIAGEPLP